MSYLKGQSITSLSSGVPLGSVLRPLLFSVYVQPIGDIITAHDLCFHHYADDLHLYSHFDLNTAASATVVRQMVDCLHDIKQWMAWNNSKIMFYHHSSMRLHSLTAVWYALVSLQPQIRDMFDLSVSSSVNT